jgi:ribonuclease P protein component
MDRVRTVDAAPAGGFRLRQSERIRRRTEFQRVYDHGSRVSGRLMTLVIAPNSLANARVGIAASRKLGDAVHRNRAKRRVREVFRRGPRVPGYDVVVIPRPELLETEFATLEREYRAALQRGLRRQS